MNNIFSTPCFIRKNTIELRKKLEEFGYTIMMGYDTGFIMTSPQNKVVYIPTGKKIEVSDDYGEYIDCGENEQLFLAIAALRDDTDRHQWFCDDDGRWEKSEDDMPSKYMQMNGHKATVKELVEHFCGRK